MGHVDYETRKYEGTRNGTRSIFLSSDCLVE